MKISPNAHWEDALALIRENVTAQQYNTWFKPIIFESYDEAKKTVLVKVPSPFVYEYLEENYVDLLKKVLSRVFCENVNLGYRIVADKEHNITTVVEGTDSDANPQPRASANKANQSPTPLDAAQPQQLDPQLNPHQTFNNYIRSEERRVGKECRSRWS